MQFGIKKFGDLKFGETYHFYIYESLLNYLPKFIVKNKLCKSIIMAIAFQMVKWQKEVQELLSDRKQDKSGIKYVNSDLQIFLHKDATDNEISNAVQDRFTIHKQRGTLKGITQDIRRLSNDANANITYFNEAYCGWWNGITFPDYDYQGKANLYLTNCYMDLDKLVEISLKNKSGYSDKELTEIICKDIIPANTSVRILIHKPHRVKFGDYRNNYKIKFGNFKFGDIINE